MRRLLLSLATIILMVTFTACDKHTKSEKEAATVKIRKHLEEKYGKEFTVNTAEDLFFSTPGSLISDVVGFEAEAYPLDTPEETFMIQYWEEKNIIDDGYINYIMVDKLKTELFAQIPPILKRNIKIDAVYGNGPWGLLPDYKYTPSTSIQDYKYTAIVDVYVEQAKSIDKAAEADNIDKIQRIFLEKGVEDLMISFYYMSPEEYEHIEQIKKEDEEDNLYKICRASATCIVSSGSVDEGKVEDDYNTILEWFDKYRETPYQPKE